MVNEYYFNRGGGAGLGLDVESQTLPTDGLNLNAKEKAELIDFLRALEDYK